MKEIFYQSISHILCHFFFQKAQFLIEQIQIDSILAEELSVQVEDGDLVAEPVKPVLVLRQCDVNSLQVHLGQPVWA